MSIAHMHCPHSKVMTILNNKTTCEDPEFHPKRWVLEGKGEKLELSCQLELVLIWVLLTCTSLYIPLTTCQKWPQNESFLVSKKVLTMLDSLTVSMAFNAEEALEYLQKTTPLD